ncbi:ATP-binding cassette domain-containing protein [Bradyrhizobium sp. 195]|uniref:hypothetical protein n=1 Tax=Bradyrhizobium sp. 195 TaxID=2782662 RepID=UPI002053BBF8|nr:hypothetical protein IVB26_07435 [Bradyrhizobium sp. 195]
MATPAESYLKPANRFVAEFLGIANFIGLQDGRSGVVRPERICLAANGEGKAARVVEAIYRPDGALSSGRRRRVPAAVPFLGSTFAKNERVVVSWDPANLWPVA